jgi:hypothetical protein
MLFISNVPGYFLAAELWDSNARIKGRMTFDGHGNLPLGECIRGPSPMVARNAWGANSRLLLAAARGPINYSRYINITWQFCRSVRHPTYVEDFPSANPDFWASLEFSCVAMLARTSGKVNVGYGHET